MNLSKNGVSVQVSDDLLIQMALERFNSPAPAAPVIKASVPRIGFKWQEQGGIYAGIARGRDGAPDYHLIVGPEHDGAIGWTDALAWAKKQTAASFADFALPYRKEQALCFANVPELFKEECYWSCEQHESYSDYAWSQSFGSGGQSYWRKDGSLRARAVRRLIIQ